MRFLLPSVVLVAGLGQVGMATWCVSSLLEFFRSAGSYSSLTIATGRLISMKMAAHGTQLIPMFT
jgi:hypothetical protein